MQETQVQSLGWEDHLEKEMATHPLQYSCLENPMDRRAWQATVHGITRVRHNLVAKPPPPNQGERRFYNSNKYSQNKHENFLFCLIQVNILFINKTNGLLWLLNF